MRALAFAALLVFLAAEALANSVEVPQPTFDFRERLNACVADWNLTPAAERGSMSYRQFTTKCLQGQKARPISTIALCRNGATAPATAREGACAFDGGVDRWLD
jgi:hypothetical protein